MSRRRSPNLRRALAALDRGNWLLAVNVLKDEIERAPDCFAAAVCLARIYLEQQRYHLAEEIVDRAWRESR